MRRPCCSAASSGSTKAETSLRATGFRCHLSWADAITLELVPGDPRVIDRRQVRVDLGDHAFPFHAAMEAEPDERAAIVAAGFEASEEAAREALREVVADLDIAAGGVVVGRGVRKMPIERIVASSQLFHSAEGEVIQHGLRAAVVDLGLHLATIRFDAAEAHQAWDTVAALGKALGPPWRKDQKLAAVAAWVAAESAGNGASAPSPRG